MSEAGLAPDARQPSRWQRTRPLLLPAAAIFGGFFIAILIWLIVSAPLGRALAPAAKPSSTLTQAKTAVSAINYALKRIAPSPPIGKRLS